MNGTMLGKMFCEFFDFKEENGSLFITFKILSESKYNAKHAVSQMKELIEKGKDIFVLSVHRHASKRSLEQNSLLWALLELMALEMSGGKKGDVQAWDCYIDMLSLTGAKYEYLMCLPEAFDFLQKQFRASKIVEERNYNGKTMYVVKCFYGSSTMNVSEMSQLIDTTIDKLNEIGVDAKYQADFDFLCKSR